MKNTQLHRKIKNKNLKRLLLTTSLNIWCLLGKPFITPHLKVDPNNLAKVLYIKTLFLTPLRAKNAKNVINRPKIPKNKMGNAKFYGWGERSEGE